MNIYAEEIHLLPNLQAVVVNLSTTYIYNLLRIFFQIHLNFFKFISIFSSFSQRLSKIFFKFAAYLFQISSIYSRNNYVNIFRPELQYHQVVPENLKVTEKAISPDHNLAQKVQKWSIQSTYEMFNHVIVVVLIKVRMYVRNEKLMRIRARRVAFSIIGAARTSINGKIVLSNRVRQFLATSCTSPPTHTQHPIPFLQFSPFGLAKIPIAFANGKKESVL